MRLTSTILALAASSALLGCAGGTRLRAPDEWRQAMTAQLKPHLTEFRKCYLVANAPHGKKIEVRLRVTSSRIGTWWFPVSDNKLSATGSGEIPDAYKEPYRATVKVRADIDPLKGKFDIGAETSSTDNEWYSRLQRCIDVAAHKIPVIPDDKNDGIAEWTFIFDPTIPITDVPDPRLPTPSYDTNVIEFRLPPGTYAGDGKFGGNEVRITGAGVGLTIIDGGLDCSANVCAVHGVTVLKKSKLSGNEVDIRNAEFKQGVDASGNTVKR